MRFIPRPLLPVLMATGGAVVVLIITTSLLATFYEAPPALSYCYDAPNGVLTPESDYVSFYRCSVERARVFLEKDYAETKDLSKAFLSLLTAVLVASITFSEKIVDVAKSGPWAKASMVTSWVCLLLAIIACGTGLALVSTAAGFAAHSPDPNYYTLEWKAVPLFVSAGLFFGTALACLLIAGIIALLDKRQAII